MLERFDPENRPQITNRIASIETMDLEVLNAMDAHLAERLQTHESTTRHFDGSRQASKILALMTAASREPAGQETSPEVTDEKNTTNKGDV